MLEQVQVLGLPNGDGLLYLRIFLFLRGRVGGGGGVAQFIFGTAVG